MKKKEIQEWVSNAIEKGYDRFDLINLLEEQKIPEETKEEILKEYTEQTENKTLQEMSWLQRRKLKKFLKNTKKAHKRYLKEIEKITGEENTLTKKQIKLLDEQKEKIIDAVIGNKEKEIIGMNSIFDVTDPDTGKELKRKDLQKLEITELEEMMGELLELLAKEI